MFTKHKKNIQKTVITIASFIAVLIVLAPTFFIHSSDVSAAASDQLSQQIQLKNPLNSNTATVPGFIKNVLSGLVLLLTPFLVIMLIYCGFLFVTAKGNAEKLGDAKKALMYTLIGAAIVLGAQGLSEIIGNTVEHLTN